MIRKNAFISAVIVLILVFSATSAFAAGGEFIASNTKLYHYNHNGNSVCAGRGTQVVGAVLTQAVQTVQTAQPAPAAQPVQTAQPAADAQPVQTAQPAAAYSYNGLVYHHNGACGYANGGVCNGSCREGGSCVYGSDCPNGSHAGCTGTGSWSGSGRGSHHGGGHHGGGHH